MEPTRDEKNRVLAEWVEPSLGLRNPARQHFIIRSDSNGIIDERAMSLLGAWIWNTDKAPAWQPVDFYTSEEAAALLLEKMPAVQLLYYPGEVSSWECHWDWFSPNYSVLQLVRDEDRKTAIAEAAYQFCTRSE